MSLSVGNFQCALRVALMSSWRGVSLLRGEQMALKRACAALGLSFPSSVASFPAVIPALLPLGHEAVAFFGGRGGGSAT